MARKRTAAYLLAMTLTLSAPMMGLALAKPAEAAAQTDSQEVVNFLNGFFAREEVKKQAGAVAVTVVKNGQVVAERGYGVTDRVSNQAVDPKRTTFRIASVSKVFTAAGLMQLVEQGKVSLDDNIEKYLDGYKLTNPFEEPVTIGMLLTHTTGFEVRDPTEANYLFDPAMKPTTLKESVFESFPPVAREPGSSYMYDNFASRLQGYIIQKVNGESFNDYMKKQVFEPLGMNSSSYVQEEELLNRLPTVYDPSGEALPVYRLSPNVIPEGSMITTAQDMSRFMIAFLNDGKTAAGKSILSPDSVKQMSTYHHAIHPDVPDTTYGFEAPFVEANGRYVITKGGNMDGFNSLLWMLPDQETGVFVTHTTNSDLYLQLFTEYMDRFYPGQSKIGEAGFTAPSIAELKKFEGIYSDLRVGALASVRANADGTLTVGNRAGVHKELKQEGELVFVDDEGVPMAFQIDGDGNVEYLKYDNPVSYSSKVPEAHAFSDVPEGHPYEIYINGLHSLGIIEDSPSGVFGVMEPVSRGQFVYEIIREFGIPGSDSKPAFTDIGNSPYRSEIQAAAEIGLLTGTGQQLFKPDRPIRREEAAAIVERLLYISGYQAKESSTELTAGTSDWAEKSVRTVIDLKLHGPEVLAKEGRTDYGSERELTKQEMAAIMYLLLLPEVSLLQ